MIPTKTTEREWTAQNAIELQYLAPHGVVRDVELQNHIQSEHDVKYQMENEPSIPENEPPKDSLVDTEGPGCEQHFN